MLGPGIWILRAPQWFWCASLWTGIWETVVWQDISCLSSHSQFMGECSLLNANALAPQCLPLLGSRMLWPRSNACGQKAPQELSKTFQHFVIISRSYLIHKDLCVFMKKERDFWATFCTGTHISELPQLSSCIHSLTVATFPVSATSSLNENQKATGRRGFCFCWPENPEQNREYSSRDELEGWR